MFGELPALKLENVKLHALEEMRYRCVLCNYGALVLFRNLVRSFCSVEFKFLLGPILLQWSLILLIGSCLFLPYIFSILLIVLHVGELG